MGAPCASTEGAASVEPATAAAPPMPAFFRNERRPVSSEEVAALAPRVAFLGSFFLDMAFSCFTRIYDSEPPPTRPRRSHPTPHLPRRPHDRPMHSGKPNTYPPPTSPRRPPPATPHASH